MELMVQYSVSILDAIATFLATEPIFYLFGIVCLIGIIKVFRALCP